MSVLLWTHRKFHSEWGDCTFNPSEPTSIFFFASQISEISRWRAWNKLCPHKFSQIVLYSVPSISVSPHSLTSSFSTSSINIECLSELFCFTTTSCITRWIRLTGFHKFPSRFYSSSSQEASTSSSNKCKAIGPSFRPLTSATAHAGARRVKEHNAFRHASGSRGLATVYLWTPAPLPSHTRTPRLVAPEWTELGGQ